MDLLTDAVGGPAGLAIICTAAAFLGMPAISNLFEKLEHQHKMRYRYTNATDVVRAVSRGRLVRSKTLAEVLDQIPDNTHKIKVYDRFWGPKAERGHKFRILSLDGGGVRGMLTARVLQRLTQACPDLMDNIDLIAGSSTGSLIACMLAKGISPADCCRMYRVSAPKIFQRRWWRSINPFASVYPAWPKESVFHQVMGDVTLGMLDRYLLVTAFCLDGIGDTDNDRMAGYTRERRPSFFSDRVDSTSWRPALFTNLPKGSGRVEPDNLLSVVDAAMRSTAAPTFFPVHQGFVDGGVFANNPALVALARVLEAYPKLTPESIVVLSLGTGSTKHKLPQSTGFDWGVLQWARWAVDLLFNSTQAATDVNLQMLLRNQYKRIDADLDIPIGLDDVTSLDALIDIADKMDLTDAIAFVRRNITEHHIVSMASVPDLEDLSRRESILLQNKY